MLLPSNRLRVLVSTQPVDFRKGHDGLASIVSSVLRKDPFTGTVFVFRSRKADRLKLLYWDGTGLVVFTMWWLMMVAMMLPSAIPAILLFEALQKSRLAVVSGRGSTLAFGAGYLAIWGIFSLGASALQWLLQSANMLSGTLGLTKWTWGAALLVAVGLYQISSLKAACLSNCRAPAQMLARFWRPGTAGALVMGIQHGIFCLGCCAFIMLLLFFGGIMSLYWVAGLALYIAVENLAPFGGRLSKLAGYGLIAVGLAIGGAYGTGQLS